MGLKTTLPQTEGGDMALPAGTYGTVIQIDDQMAQLKHYYRSLVAVMRKLKIKGTSLSMYPRNRPLSAVNFEQKDYPTRRVAPRHILNGRDSLTRYARTE